MKTHFDQDDNIYHTDNCVICNREYRLENIAHMMCNDCDALPEHEMERIKELLNDSYNKKSDK